MKKKVVRILQWGLFICLCIQCFLGEMANLQAATKDGKPYKIGEITSYQRDASDRPNGPIYGQAQMNYVFQLTKGNRTIQMGRGGESGIGYMNTPQGSVYCMDPERFACASVGEGLFDEYRVEDYQEANSERIGLIWYYGNAKHANDANYMDYVALTQIMIWEELGWHADIQSGFNQYETLKNEVERKIKEHVKTPQWEIVETDVENSEEKFQFNEDTWNLVLEPGKHVTLKDSSGVFSRYYAHWDTIPSGIKVERVTDNAIKLTALSGYSTNATIQYSEVEPEMIGHAYLLKPNVDAGAEECQTLIMPYVNESVSNIVKFHVSSEGGDSEKEEIEVTYPKLIKVDQENNFPLEGATFAIFSAQTIKENFEIEKEVCHVESESGEEVCETTTTKKSASIWNKDEKITEIVSDSNGFVDLSCLESLYDQKVSEVSEKLLNESSSNISVIALGRFIGGKFAYQEIQTSGESGSYFGYYNENRNKKQAFTIDSNSGNRTIYEKNKRQKGKIVFRKVDGDDYYLNHHIKEIPQGDASFENAVFNLYAKEDIIIPNGLLVHRAGDLIEQITTNKLGIGESSILELGKYELEEVQLPEGYWYYDYQRQGQKVEVDIRYSSQEHSLRVFTFNQMEVGEISPFEEVEIQVQDGDVVNQSLNYRNSVQKGHVEIAKHFEGEIDDQLGETSSKLPVEGVYFGIYLNSKSNNEYQTNLPDEFFMSQQLNGTVKLNRPQSNEKEANYDVVHERSLYMVLKSNELGIASSKDPDCIVWANLAKINVENSAPFTKGIPLPYGEYTVEELNTPQGYIPNSFQLNISKVSEELAEIRTNQFEYVFATEIIQNQRTLQDVIISKRDSESGDLILVDDAIFKIWKWNVNEIIDQEKIYTHYDERKKDWIIGIKTESKIQNETGNGGHMEVSVDTSKGKWINQYESNSQGIQLLDRYETNNGQVHLPQPLMVGDYLLCELKAPKGYALSKVPFAFTVNDINQSVDIHENQFIQVPMLDENGEVKTDMNGNTIYVWVPKRITIHLDETNDPQKGFIILRKEGDVFDKFIKKESLLGLHVYQPIFRVDALANGAIFEVFADGDVFVNQQKIYQSGERVDRLRIDVHGYATSVPLPLGHYFIKEAESKDGYVTNNEVIKVTLNAKNQRQVVFPQFLKTMNQRKKPTIEFTKLLQTNHGYVQANQVYFGLYSDEYLMAPIEEEYDERVYEETDVEVFDYTYNDELQGYRINGFKNDSLEKIWIPAIIDDVPVNEIAANAFFDQGIKSLVIPKTIKRIGASAFASNELTRVEFKTNNNIRFEDETIFLNNVHLVNLIVDDLNYLDTVQLGYDIFAPFEEKDGRCLGIKLIRKNPNSKHRQDLIQPLNLLELEYPELEDESEFVYPDTLLEVIEVKNGKGEVESELLDGKYYLKEISAPSQYRISEEKIDFVYDQGKPIVIHSGMPIINQFVETPPQTPHSVDSKVKIIVNKFFEKSEKHETQAIFTIFDATKQRVGEIQVTENSEVVASFALKPGKYTIKETWCSDDYFPSNQIIEFDVKDNTREILITPNEPIINELKRTNLLIHKIDSESKLPLRGAVFGLYDEEINLLERKTSDIQGKLTFENLECGVYYLKEIKAPETYLRDEELYPIHIRANNQHLLEPIEMVIENDAGLSVDYPETGRIISNKVSFELIVVAFGIYLFALFLKKES